MKYIKEFFKVAGATLLGCIVFMTVLGVALAPVMLAEAGHFALGGYLLAFYFFIIFASIAYTNVKDK